jgi:hypothetical protein
MKAEILKIAGVKSEKEFYKKFPTEESFIKVHGKALKKAQIGAMIQGNQSPQINPQPINFQQLYDQNDMFITGSTQDMRNKQAQDQASLAAQQKMTNKKSGVIDAINQIGKIAGGISEGAKNGKKLKKAQGGIENVIGKVGKGLGAGVNKLGGPMAAAQSIGDVVGGIQQMKAEKQTMNQAQQMAGVSDVALQASMTRPEQVQKKYVRPEDNINTGQEFFPIYGVGTTLAKNGTEIANTFAPYTIYTDLEEAANGMSFGTQDFFKFAEQGGGDAISQLTAGLGSPKGQGISGGGKLGGGIGSAAGTLIGGPIGGMIGKFAGQTLGNVLDRKAEKTEAANRKTQSNIEQMAFNQGTQALQQQNYSYMRDGGMANPQVINQFGNYKLSQLLQPDPTMDTLRAGGHLKSYTPPSERAMYTGREQFAMGGDLETHWGGYAEPMSYNPYLPEGGETIMFRGQSHDESDGKGNTGIGITYGESPVEVERGEPAVQLKNGTGGDNSLTVYGNLKVPKFGAEMIGAPKAAGKKFKNYVADLSKTEQKQNKLIDKAVTELDNLDVNNPYDLLKFESYKANMLGANQKLKNIADEKIKLADLQSAINDTAEEYNLVADDLAQGKVKKAQSGTRIRGGTTTYQPGLASFVNSQLATMSQTPQTATQVGPVKRESSTPNKSNKSDNSNKKVNREKVELINLPTNTLEDLRSKIKDRTGLFSPIAVPESIDKAGLAQRPVASTTQAVEPSEEKFDWMDIVNQVLPYVRPTDAEALDPRQLSGEMLALATNQVEPVQAQTFQPQLNVPYDISLQDIINKNQADYRAAQRMMGYNPAAQAALNAQKYQANQQVLGEQFRLNQAMRDKVFAENRNLLNQSNLQNLQILDQQYGRQQQALSNTKATAQAALNSISAKYLQNQAENRQLQTYENLYNYRFDPRFRAMNMNPLAQFNLEGSGSSGTSFGNMTPEEIELYAKQLKVAQDKQKKMTKSKNGALVKAIKSM